MLKRWVFSFCFVTMVVSAAWAAPKAVWSPNKALVKQLASATVVGPYQIHPPKGYVLKNLPGPSGITASAWVGTLRPNGTRNVLMLVVFTPPPGQKNQYTLTQVSAKFLASVARKRKNWKQTPSETGTINGLKFVRVYSQGTDIKTGLPLDGFSYVALAGKGFLALTGEDAEPYSKTTLPLAEASALTLIKH